MQFIYSLVFFFVFFLLLKSFFLCLNLTNQEKKLEIKTDLLHRRREREREREKRNTKESKSHVTEKHRKERK